MELASRSVKVVLDGQGADEQLGGYLAYQGSYLSGLLRGVHIPTALSELAGSYRYHSGFFRDAISQVRARRKRRSLLRGEIPLVLPVHGEPRRGPEARDPLHQPPGPPPLGGPELHGLLHRVPGPVPRSPGGGVPGSTSPPPEDPGRVSRSTSSGRPSAGLVPEAIRCRMDKMGFVTPEEAWMKKGLRPFVLEILTSPSFRARKYWDADQVLASYTGLPEGRAPTPRRFGASPAPSSGSG